MFGLDKSSFNVVGYALLTLFLVSAMTMMFVPLDVERGKNVFAVWAFSSGAVTTLWIRKEEEKKESDDNGEEAGKGEEVEFPS